MLDAKHPEPKRGHLGSLVQVTFELDPSAWHGYATERLWAKVLSPGRYQLENTPFYAKGVSFEDVVAASADGPEWVFSGTLESQGHSTYRVFIKHGVDSPGFALRWRPLQELGCSFEQGGRLLAVDVPPRADIRTVYRLFEQGAADEIWDFEEGHCGHALGG